VAIGSFEPTQDENFGYLYVFDINSNMPLWISENFGDYVSAVSLSDNGEIIFGASWGDYYNSVGYRGAIYTRDGLQLISFPSDTYPGSWFDCSLSRDGMFGAGGGKRVHAREMGSGGYLYAISIEYSPPTPTFTPLPTYTPTQIPPTSTFTPLPTNTPLPSPTSTPIPTSTPTVQPTNTPTPPPTLTPTPTKTYTPTSIPPSSTPTPLPCQLGVELLMPAHFFKPGDECWLNASICNPGPQIYYNLKFFLVLDINTGDYWFYPGWKHFPPEIDYEIIEQLNIEIIEKEILPTFYWPPNCGSMTNIKFISLLMDEAMSEIIGNIATWEFGFSE